MKIRHRSSKKKIELSFNKWVNNYLFTGLYQNYDIIEYSHILELVKFDIKTKKQKFVKVVDLNEYKQEYKNNDLYSTRNLKEGEVQKICYDPEHYKLKNNKNSHNYSFLRLGSAKAIAKLTTKAITISSVFIASNIVKIAIGVIGGLLVLIIWHLYKTELIDLFNAVR